MHCTGLREHARPPGLAEIRAGSWVSLGVPGVGASQRSTRSWTRSGWTVDHDARKGVKPVQEAHGTRPKRASTITISIAHCDTIDTTWPSPRLRRREQDDPTAKPSTGSLSEAPRGARPVPSSIHARGSSATR